MSSSKKGEGGSGGGPGDVAGGGSVNEDKLLESGERVASTRRTAGRGAVQNGGSSALNKRSGREWKTCFEEIRAGKRRVLRSDVARIRAEAEAARKRSEEEGGRGVEQDDDCFEISFQNGSDWIKVGEDVKAEKKENLKSELADKTEESDTHMENGTEETLLNDDQLRSNSSTRKRGEGEEMEAEKERLAKSCVLEQMEDPDADEQKTAEASDISEKKAIKVAEAEKKKITEESDSGMKKVTEEAGSDERELTEVSDTSLKKVTGEVAYGAYQYQSSCSLIERNGREQIKCGDLKEVEMSGTMGLDAAKKREEEDTCGNEVMDYKAPEADGNTNNSINESNGIKWMKCKETEVNSTRVPWPDITKAKEEGKPDCKEVGEDTDTNLKKVMKENDTDKSEATEVTIPEADQHGKSATISRRSCTEQMKCSNEFEVEKKIMKLDAANQRGEVDIVRQEVSEEAASGVQHNRITITSKNNNVNHENEVEKRITRSASAKQRKETDNEKKKVKEKAGADNNEATEEFVPGADQNRNISAVRKRIGMEQIACEEEINIEKQIVGMDDANHSKEARSCRKKVKKEAGSRIDAEDMEQIKCMETKLDNKRIMGLNVAKRRRETITHKKKVMKDSVSGFTQNKMGFSNSKSHDPEQIGFEEIKIKNNAYIKSNKEKQKKEMDTINKKVMKSVLNKRRGRETSNSETTMKKIKSESLKYGRDRTEEFSGKKINFDSSNRRDLGCKSAVPATGPKDGLDEKTMLRSTRGQGRAASNKKVDGLEKAHVLSEDGDNKRNRGFPVGSHSISKRRILSVKREGLTKPRGVKMEPKSLSPQVAPLNLKSSNGKSKVMVKQESSSIRLSKKNKGTSGEGRKEAKDKVRDQIKNILLSAGWRIDLRPRKGKNYEDSVYISPRGSGYWSITKAYEVFQMEFNHTHNDKAKDVSRSSSKSSKRSEGLGFPFSAIPIEDLSMLKKKIVKRSKDELKKGKKKLGDGSRSKKSKKAGKLKYLKNKDYKGETKGKVKENDTAGSGSKGITGHAPKKPHSGRYKKRRGCALLVRGSKQDRETGSDGYVPYVWKRTILSWMIDLGIVSSNGKVKYMNQKHTEAVLEGWITRDGIKCNCCNKILAVSKFEIHAGSTLAHPYQNIFVEETGVPLSQCLLDAWKKQDESERQGFYTVDIDGDDPNDDTCGICGDGGDLICCDSCPSTFHLNCLGFQMLPPGDWHCMNCSCRFCEVSSGSDAQENGGTVPQLLTCSLCEEKYHQTCIAKLDDVSVSSSYSLVPFCRCSCKEIFERLQRLLGVKNDLEAGFSWTLVQRFDEDSPEPACGLDQRAECNSKIAVALAVMHECFSPVIDQRSGINLIHNVIYNCGSNFNRLNFRGFYTFILERDDEIISTASLRIHGTRLAEMPFIGTRNMYRRQGMCRRLLAEIESVLFSLNIEKLVIPAISELQETWTKIFGFQPLEVSHKQEIRSLNMVVFPETSLLQKPLLKEDSTNQSKTAEGVDKAVPESKHHHTLEVANESSFCSFVESVPQAAIVTTVQCEHEIKQRESMNGCTVSTFDMSVESSDAPCGSKFEASDYRPLETAADEDLMLHPKAVSNEESMVRSKFQPDTSIGTETSLLCLGTKHAKNNAKIVEAGISRDLLDINGTSGEYIIDSICTSPVVIASNLQDSCTKDAVNFPANDGNHNPKDQIANPRPNCQVFDEGSTYSNSEMVAEPLNAINPLHMTSLPEPDVHSDGGVTVVISHKTNDDAGHAERSPHAFSEGSANHAIEKFTSLNPASESDFLSSSGLKSSKKVASNLPDSSNCLMI
ncbi:uncharacterized protein [Elaeis guineensis]|uniref:Uncharacterized protein LOC105042291 n=1 Tax=Elaeis guineensis var. tenera TaxID=51953 RepID=A0A6J0PFV1_ELAGV|nr:uncharacterized protein LOC105042291 [Elaeis guineensis]XP_019704925.1 uncharacterized protein LOC105042291 [Elaeis guineensis]